MSGENAENLDRVTLMGKRFERTFKASEIRTLLAEALAIVEELDPPGELAGRVFDQAIALLGNYTELEGGIARAPAMTIPGLKR